MCLTETLEQRNAKDKERRNKARRFQERQSVLKCVK